MNMIRTITILLVFVATQFLQPAFAQRKPYQMDMGTEWDFSGALISSGTFVATGSTEFSGAQNMTGTLTLSNPLIMENGEEIVNSADGIIDFVADDNAVDLLTVGFGSDNTATENANTVTLEFFAQNSVPASTVFTRIQTFLDDITDGTEDARIEFSAMLNGALTRAVTIVGDALSPTADQGTTLGTAAFRWGASWLGGDITMENGEVVENGTDAKFGIVFDDDAVVLGEIAVSSTNVATENSNEFRYTTSISNDASIDFDAGRITVKVTDVTDGTEDSEMLLGITGGGSFFNVIAIKGAGIYPAANGTFDLGESATRYRQLYVNVIQVGARVHAQGSGTITTGNTTVAITITGLDTDDLVLVTPTSIPTNPNVLVHAVPTADTLTITVSTDPGAAGQDYTYQVWMD